MAGSFWLQVFISCWNLNTFPPLRWAQGVLDQLIWSTLCWQLLPLRYSRIIFTHHIKFEKISREGAYCTYLYNKDIF